MNPGHKYSSSGTYKVRMVAYKTNTPGIVCTDTLEKFITIVDTLYVAFDPSKITGYCSPFTVTFNNIYKDNIYAEWDFGDSTTARGDSVEHTYTIPGTYQVKLYVKGSAGCNYVSNTTVELFSPSGTVEFKNGYSCVGESVRFEANASLTDSIEWHFGDGDSIITTSTVVTHAYLKPGIYIPKVKFLNTDGCAYEVEIKDTIKIDQVLTGFNISQEEFCGYTKVLFKDTSFTFFGKDSIQWKFGDESTGNLFEESHIYTSSNTYLVQSIVTGISGCTDTSVISVPVFVRSLPFVQVKGDTVICSGEEVRLEAVIKSEDPILLEKWIGPNGSVINGTVYENIFVTAGYYRFTFISGTIYGCYDTTYYNVLVNPTPAVKTIPDFTLCYGKSATLTATGADSVYNWFPTEGLSCSNCRTPIAKPDNSISYIVRGTTKKGCYAFDTVNITVVPPIDVTVSKDDSICIGESVQLLARGAKYYRWFPAEGLSSDTIQNPIASPTRTTRYRVIGYDEYGCFRDTAYVLVGVGGYPKVNLGPDRVLSTGTLLKLEPTFTEGPIETWLWRPDKDLSCSSCPSAIVQVKTDITYVVKATNYFGCSGTDSINIKVFCTDAQVYIPNAFTPDNDGYNDIFMIRATGIQQVKSFRIFNRWGALIFEKINFKPNDPNFAWDGTIRGRTSAPEVFVYTVEVICDDGTPYFYKGNVSLLK